MTASQMKRIRTKLQQAALLTSDAHQLALDGHADYGLKELTARAADDMSAARRALQAWDDRMALHADAIARELKP